MVGWWSDGAWLLCTMRLPRFWLDRYSVYALLDRAFATVLDISGNLLSTRGYGSL